MVLLVIYICCGVYPCPGTHTNSPVLSSTLSRSGHGRCHRSSPRGWRLIQPCTTIVKGGDCPQVWCQPPAPPPYFSTIIFQTHNLPIIKCWLPMPMYYPIYPSSHKNITFYFIMPLNFIFFLETVFAICLLCSFPCSEWGCGQKYHKMIQCLLCLNLNWGY